MSWTTEMLVGMRDLVRLYEKMLKQVSTDHHLTVVGAEVVSVLQNNPQKDTAADIVELRKLSKAAVSKAVESLIQKSILKRSPDSKDRRKIHLILQTEAALVTEQIDAVREEFLREILFGFTMEELKENEQFCRRLFENAKKSERKKEES